MVLFGAMVECCWRRCLGRRELELEGFEVVSFWKLGPGSGVIDYETAVGKGIGAADLVFVTGTSYGQNSLIHV